MVQEGGRWGGYFKDFFPSSKKKKKGGGKSRREKKGKRLYSAFSKRKKGLLFCDRKKTGKETPEKEKRPYA